MPKNMQERIASMEEQLRALKSRHHETETKRKRDEAHKEKKDNARRKLLAGTVLLAVVERGEITQAQFHQWLDSALTQPKDRALFDL